MKNKIDAHKNILSLIGNTPLIRLNRIVKDFKGSYYAKYEAFNPGHSNKDRIALHIIESAEKKGLIDKNTTIIETTSGNTGFSLSMVSMVKGYKCIVAVSSKSSADKIDMLKSMGAGLIIQNNKLLIGLRSESDNGGGLWEFPGGKIEIDESSENAVIRELSEELDIIVRKPKKIMQYLHRFKNLIYDISFFEVISFKGSIKKIVHDELEWADLDSIKNYNFISGDLLIIERLMNKPSLLKGLE